MAKGLKLWLTGLKSHVVKILAPGHLDFYQQRQIFNFNILLIGSLILNVLALMVSLVNSIIKQQYIGNSPLILVGILLILSLLLLLVRQKQFKLAASLFLLFLLIPTGWASLKWGSLLPQAVLTFAWIIVTTGLLLSSRAGLIVAGLIGFFLCVAALLQNQGLIMFDDAWRQQIYSLSDALVAALTLALIGLFAWLANRNIQQALHKARASERALEKERDLLDVKVKQKAEQVKQMQLDQLKQTYQFIEFGKMTAALIHELVDPLTLLCLNLEAIEEEGVSKPDYEQLQLATEKMSRLICSARRQLQQQEIKKDFSIKQEIEHALTFLQPKAKKRKVVIVTNYLPDQPRSLYGNPVKFSQVVTNLVANAIEAYPAPVWTNAGNCKRAAKHKQRLVEVSVSCQVHQVKIKIRDQGQGIPLAQQEQIFQPMFSTKNYKNGTGIGLYMSKNIIERDFQGEITFTSQPGQGTEFCLSIPFDSHEDITSTT
jgi:signal transduction histidine kinase